MSGSALGPLEPAGPQAEAIARLIHFFFWTTGTVYAVVLATLVAALLRRRKRETGERTLSAAVGLALGITLAVLALLTGASYWTSHRITRFRPARPIEIEVTGHQWWWELRYLNEEPSRIFQSANELHIPVGRAVALKLKTADVVHSFWVPQLHGKRDLIPGQENVLWLQADRPGLYRGRCAEFCGLQHAHMELLVIAEPQTDFEAWQTHQLKEPSPPADPIAQRGKQLFLSGPCVMCHTIAGTLAQATAGPDLTHLASRQALAGGTLPNTRGHRAGWVMNAQVLKPGGHMPSIALGSEELQAVLAYLETLR